MGIVQTPMFAILRYESKHLACPMLGKLGAFALTLDGPSTYREWVSRDVLMLFGAMTYWP